MPFSSGKWTTDSASSDGELFIGTGDFVDTSNNSTITSSGAGNLAFTVAASKSCTFFANLGQILRPLALGYANAGLAQRQFGTAAGVPGPSSVANTSGPSALPAGHPGSVSPYVPATVAGPTTGVSPKGLQINWVDICYSVTAVNLFGVGIGITNTVFNNGVAPVVTTLLLLGNNGMPLGFQIQPRRYRVTPTTIAFLTADGSQPIINVNLITNAGGTAAFYGVIVGLSYNYQ
jgi:hypothetical protein